MHVIPPDGALSTVASLLNHIIWIQRCQCLDPNFALGALHPYPFVPQGGHVQDKVKNTRMEAWRTCYNSCIHSSTICFCLTKLLHSHGLRQLPQMRPRVLHPADPWPEAAASDEAQGSSDPWPEAAASDEAQGSSPLSHKCLIPLKYTQRILYIYIYIYIYRYVYIYIYIYI